MRRILFWTHLGAGVVLSFLILFFSVTGALLAYERQILNAVDQRSFQFGAHGSAVRMRLAVLIAAVPGVPESVTIHPGETAPAEVQTTNRELFLVDRYSGTVQGPASPRLRAFFAEVTALHRWFGLSSAQHATAMAIKGAAALVFLLLLVTGPFLWIPKRWTLNAVRGGVVPRFDTQGRARNYNWHKVTGFWIGLPLAILVLTGVVMAYSWANALLFRVAGSPMPVRPGNGAGSRGREGGAPLRVPPQLDEAFAQATKGIGDWQSASLRLPAARNGLNFSIDRSKGGHPEKREMIIVDGASLRVLRREPFALQSRGQQWRAWVRFLHTGEAGGWLGESVALASASGAIVLALTGLGLSYDRLRRWRSRAD